MNGGTKSLTTWFLAMISSIEASGVIQLLSACVGLLAGVFACQYYIDARKEKKSARLLNEAKLKELNKGSASA